MTGLLRQIRRARLAVKLATLAVLVVATTTTASFWALSTAVRAGTNRVMADELARSQRALLALQRRALEQSLLTASLLTKSPTLRAAIETLRDERSRGGGARPALQATLQRELETLRDGSANDLLVVTDDQGRVLAAAGARVASALAGAPIVHHALDRDAAVDSASLGLLETDGTTYQATAVPIVLGGYLIGALVTGERIDTERLAALGRAFDGELVVRTPTAVLASTGGGPDATDRPDGEDFVSTTLPLGLTSSGEPAVLELRYPLMPVRKALTATLVANFVLWGGAAVLLGGFGAGLVSRRVLQPLQRIVDVMRTGASTGIRDRQLDTGDAAREVRSLAESYTALMDSLDAERRALEQRGAELAAANTVLRQEIEERERAERALHEREEQLRRSQKLEAIGTLAGGVAHDFNNLLSVISGFTEMAIAQAQDGEPVIEELLQVVGASKRAALLTRQLLAFGRKQVLQPRVLDLAEVVGGVEPMLRRLIGEHIVINTTATRPLAPVYADPGQLEQVIVNLVVNARDAMPTGGTLSIACENGRDAERATVVLIVRDTGMGMSAETRSRVFEPFFTTKDPGKGTGLGLATVYGIVTQSGGRIEIDSAVGVGTTFTITLPATDTEVAASVAIPEDDAAPRGTETILLVEDESALRLLAERALSTGGYTVLSAESGETALGLARSHPGEIHLVVTDVVMPAMSGPMLVTRLAALRPKARILYVSGYADDTIANYRLEPSSAFLAKPFVPTTLLRKVRETLDARAMVGQPVSAR